MSVVGRMHPDWTAAGDDLPESVILKIPSVVNSLKYFESTDIGEKIDQPKDKEKSEAHYREILRKASFLNLNLLFIPNLHIFSNVHS